MGHPQIAAFARLANGNAKPLREIYGQKTLFTRTMHDLAYNPISDEIVVGQIHARAIMTYRGAANGDEAPIRIIQGPDTRMKRPDRLRVDAIHKEIFEPDGDKVLVFPSDAEGNVAPIRVIEGPDTMLGSEGRGQAADALAIDPVNNILIVTGQAEGHGHVLMFRRTDSGDAKPIRMIRGLKTGLDNGRCCRLAEVYPPRKLYLVGAPGDEERNDTDSFVGVWNYQDDGDVAARWTLGGPQGVLRQVRGVALDPKHKSVIVSDKYLNSVFTFYFPEIF